MDHFELQRFLDYSNTGVDQYKTCRWRETTFEQNFWKFIFNNKKIQVDFNITLHDGSSLIARENSQLLTSIKFYLCFQLNPQFAIVDYRAVTAYNRLSYSLSALDHLLLSTVHLGWQKLKLCDITNNDYKWLLHTLSLHNHNEESIYHWREKLTFYLRLNARSTSKHVIDNTLATNSFLLAPICSEEERTLGLDDDEIISARAWLWINGLYQRSTSYMGFTPNTLKLSEKLYTNTLRGISRKTPPPELIIGNSSYRYSTECKREHVRQTTPGLPILPSMLSCYHTALSQLRHLSLVGLPSPPEETFNVELSQILSDQTEEGTLKVRNVNKYKTLPFDVALYAIKSACEFINEYGKDILTSIAAIRIQSHISATSCRDVVSSNGIESLVTPALVNLGVEDWCYSMYTNNDNNRFEHTRLNKGLYELSRVLYGAIQILIGCTMAKRQSELIEICADNVIGSHLLLTSMKTGLGELRESEYYPIHHFAAYALTLTRDFQTTLLSNGVIDELQPLFSRPGRRSKPLILPTQSNFNSSMDAFCDYFELDTKKPGVRYYIRQHQLRRFFAQLFFWSYGSGQVEILIWMLGHTSSEQFYRYISENTPGEVLRNVKSEWTAHELKANHLEAHPLQTLILNHFGTNKVSVIDDAELIDYLDYLQHDNLISVTPLFPSEANQTDVCIVYEIQ